MVSRNPGKPRPDQPPNEQPAGAPVDRWWGGLNPAIKTAVAVAAGLTLLLVSLEPLWTTIDRGGEGSAEEGVAEPESASRSAAISWRTDLDAAKAEAAAKNLPLLLNFTADWCPPCRLMKKTVFPDRRVSGLINGSLIPVTLDLTQPNAPGHTVGQAYGVEALPTSIVLTPGGAEMGRLVGGVDAAEFAKWLAAPDTRP